MTKLNEKRNAIVAQIIKDYNADCYAPIEAAYDAALAELMPQVQKLVGALRVIVETTGDDKFVAKQALTEWQEYVGGGISE